MHREAGMCFEIAVYDSTLLGRVALRRAATEVVLELQKSIDVGLCCCWAGGRGDEVRAEYRKPPSQALVAAGRFLAT